MLDVLKAVSLKFSTWDRIHLVNVLFFAYLTREWPSLVPRLSLLPDPIPLNARRSKHESRLALNLPVEGTYLGVVGSLDPRKAIPELLTAFRTASSSSDQRLLLAGVLAPSHRLVIAERYTDLIADQRLIILDRFLDRAAFQAALTAVDAICIPYPRFGHLSGMLLHAVAAGRPILANAYGWQKVMVELFGLGWTCNVLDHDVLARTVEMVLEEAPSYQQSPAAQRLRDYHLPENFAAAWLEGLRADLTLPPDPARRAWDWVIAALDIQHIQST
jgi:glycosyltransferase involved in cell wall biosynthesis